MRCKSVSWGGGKKVLKSTKNTPRGKRGAYRGCFLCFLVIPRPQISDEKQEGKRETRSLVEPPGSGGTNFRGALTFINT